MARTVETVVTTTVVSDLASDKGATENLVNVRVSFVIDATQPAIDRLIASLRKTGVPADALKVTNRDDAKPAGSGTAGGDTEQSRARVWAQANGIAVGERGRVKAETVELFRAAGSPVVTPAVAAEVPAAS